MIPRSQGELAMIEIREADLARDLQTVRGLWLDDLTLGNDEMESRHGFRLPVQAVSLCGLRPPGTPFGA